MRRVLAMAALLGLGILTVPIGTATAASGSGKDKAILQAGVITPSDVPSSWQANPQKDPGTKQFKGIAACKQIAALQAAAHKVPNKRSQVFTDPNNALNTLAENIVYAYKGAAAASRGISVYQASTTPTCFQAVLEKQIGSKGRVGALSPIMSLQGAGDESVGYEGTIQISGQSPEVVDYVVVRVGRAFMGFVFTNSDRSIAQGPQIVGAVINRVSQVAA